MVNDHELVGVKLQDVFFYIISVTAAQRQMIRSETLAKQIKGSNTVFLFCFCQFVQLRRSTTQTKNFAKAVVNMADAVGVFKMQQNL